MVAIPAVHSFADIPPSIVSPFDLAMTLPDLWVAHDRIDDAVLKLRGEPYECGRHEMLALADRIEAVEGLVLETPACNLADALAQQIVLLPRVREQFELPCTARTMAGTLRVMLPLCSNDFSELLKHYAPCLNASA